MSKTVWSYASVPDTDRWSEPYQTRDEAILAGRAEYSGERFWIQSGHEPDPETFLPFASDIVEQMADGAGNEAGEAAEEWPDVSKQALKDLDDFLKAWAKKHCKVNFWVATGQLEEIPAREGK